MFTEESKIVTNDVPGLGKVNAKSGTATSELAGAAVFWHEKSSTAWSDGFKTACFMYTVAVGLVAGIYFIL